MELKTYYLQVRPDLVVTDAIEFAYKDYVPYETEYLPADVMGGWYKLIDGVLVEVPELKPEPVQGLLYEDAIAEFPQYRETIDIIFHKVEPPVEA